MAEAEQGELAVEATRSIGLDYVQQPTKLNHESKKYKLAPKQTPKVESTVRYGNPMSQYCVKTSRYESKVTRIGIDATWLSTFLL